MSRRDDVERAHDGWNGIESGLVAHPPTALAGDQLEALAVRICGLGTHNGRLGSAGLSPRAGLDRKNGGVSCQAVYIRAAVDAASLPLNVMAWPGLADPEERAQKLNHLLQGHFLANESP